MDKRSHGMTGLEIFKILVAFRSIRIFLLIDTDIIKVNCSASAQTGQRNVSFPAVSRKIDTDLAPVVKRISHNRLRIVIGGILALFDASAVDFQHSWPFSARFHHSGNHVTAALLQTGNVLCYSAFSSHCQIIVAAAVILADLRL